MAIWFETLFFEDFWLKSIFLKHENLSYALLFVTNEVFLAFFKPTHPTFTFNRKKHSPL